MQKKYGIIPHSELESEHYQLVKNDPLYRMEGLLDVWREEMMMSLPVFPQETPSPKFIVQPCNNDHKIEKLQGELIALRDTLQDHLKKRKSVVKKWD